MFTILPHFHPKPTLFIKKDNTKLCALFFSLFIFFCLSHKPFTASKRTPWLQQTSFKGSLKFCCFILCHIIPNVYDRRIPISARRAADIARDFFHRNTFACTIVWGKLTFYLVEEFSKLVRWAIVDWISFFLYGSWLCSGIDYMYEYDRGRH